MSDIIATKRRRLADDIRDCIAEGLALSETARKLGKSASTIWVTARNAGLKFEKKLPAYFAQPDCRKFVRKPNATNEAIVADYRAGGVSYSDLAAKYGVSRSAVAGAIYRAKGAPA